MIDDITSVTGLAAAAKCTEQVVRQRIRGGKLTARKVNGRWVIDEREARDFLATPRNHPPSQRTIDAMALGLTGEGLKSRRRRGKAPPARGQRSGNAPSYEAPSEPELDPQLATARERARVELNLKLIKQQHESLRLRKAEGALYEADVVERAYRGLAQLACSLLRNYASQIPLLVQEQLPHTCTPEDVAALQATLSQRLLAMVQRDIETLSAANIVSASR